MAKDKKAANVTRQRVGKMMRGLFEILLEHPDGIAARDAMAELRKRVPPTEYELGSYPSGGERYEKIVRFSTVDLVKAGWMVKDNIPVEELRSFLAMLSGDDVGLYVSTSGFTRDAEAEARTQHTRKITLIDRERLVELWIEYMDRIDEDARRRLPLRPIYVLAPVA
jgi:hypothetical protein